MDRLNSPGKIAFGLCIAFDALDSVAVVLRFVTRRSSKTKLGLDDWTILAALVLMYVTTGLEIWALIAANGTQTVGPNSTPQQLEYLEHFLRGQFIAWPFYFAVLTFTRWSITAFYRRIFTTSTFRKWSYFLDLNSAIYFIISLFVNIFACKPYYHLWDLTDPGSCVNLNLFIAIQETYGIVIDSAILAMPIRIVLKLQMSMRTKVGVISIFLMGGFVIITNIVRLVFIRQGDGHFVNFTSAAQWSDVHAGSAIICACLPTYKTLFPIVAAYTCNLRQKYGSLVLGNSRQSKPTSTTTTSATSKNLSSSGKPGDPDFSYNNWYYLDMESGRKQGGHLAEVKRSNTNTNGIGIGMFPGQVEVPAGRVGVVRTVNIEGGVGDNSPVG